MRWGTKGGWDEMIWGRLIPSVCDFHFGWVRSFISVEASL